MKPEAARELALAREALANARTILGVDIPSEAARLAYYAAFHAAKALIFERYGKAVKTHGGVHKEFHRLARSEPAFEDGLRAFLSKSYDFKLAADYAGGPDVRLPKGRALEAVETAQRFVERITEVLGSPDA